MSISLIMPCLFLAEIGAIRIDTGRQLFVDDFLIASTNGVVRHWNVPTKAERPVLCPAADDSANLIGATDGGLWWDPALGKYRLWYQKNWLGTVHYAESRDGFEWSFPDLGHVPCSNRVFDEKIPLDSWSVHPDYVAVNPYAHWCMHVSSPGGITDDTLYESTDGLSFRKIGIAGQSGDRTSVYYDPFCGEWVFALRDYRDGFGRANRRFHSQTFAGAKWNWPDDAEKWLVATNRPNWQLYNFDAVPYESLMLGVMEILYNTPNDNDDCMKVGLPKQTGLHFCFSRDGRTFVPRNEPDIAPSGWGSGKWDSGYLATMGGICTVDDEKLMFYYSGLRGDGTRLERKDSWKNGMYSNGSIGYATLRRDGFAGMVADGIGEIVTKPLLFGGSHLFVNGEFRFGSLAVEVLDESGNAIDGFSVADCEFLKAADKTRAEIRWRSGDIRNLSGRVIALRFKLHCGTLYSFWVSRTARGESNGYVAAGGPAYRGLRDE